MRHVIVAMTGASGASYGRRLVARLAADASLHLHLVVSAAALRVLAEEDGLELDAGRPREALAALAGPAAGRATWHPVEDIGASIASGSFRTLGMAVVPCSMGTLSAIAHGASRNLVERAADVCLKERRRLILVTRETPLSLVHLENMTAATRAGAVVLPASPGFYHRPRTIEDLLDFVVGRVLDHLDLPHDLVRRPGVEE